MDEFSIFVYEDDIVITAPSEPELVKLLVLFIRLLLSEMCVELDANSE